MAKLVPLYTECLNMRRLCGSLLCTINKYQILLYNLQITKLSQQVFRSWILQSIDFQMLDSLIQVGIVDKVSRHRHRVRDVLHPVRGTAGYEEQLTRQQVHTVIELWVEGSSVFGRVESPFFPARNEIHPEVRSKSVNMQTTVRPFLCYKQAWPAVVVQS